MLSVGTKAPDFTVKDNNNTPVSLKNYRGNKVVLWFYPKADTPGCTQEGKGFREKAKDFEQKNIVIFGISLDTVAENKSFAEKFDFPYPLLCDVDKQIAKTYHAIQNDRDQYASRITYVIDEEGKIAEAIEEVNTATHAHDLCTRL